ncbi:MAG: helix-turn-helix domain-containing protein [Treponema sp.]|jgi:DNA-binding transcriptional ArsR family regulator|nr:helix-turn-helix domain-containing protein [Treponema sp.]
MNENPSYFAIIPAKVRYDRLLSPAAKILYGEITALSNKEGYCWASNGYFADCYGVDKSSVTKWIKRLAEAGHVRIELIYADDKPLVKERRIYITDPHVKPQRPPEGERAEDEDTPETEETGGSEIFHQGGENFPIGGGEIFHRGGEKSKGIIIQANNKNSLNTINSAAADETAEKAEQTGPPEAEAAVADLKQKFKDLDGTFVFDESFYRTILRCVNERRFDLGYLSWLYQWCRAKKPRDITSYYFKIFFEPRLLELYRGYLVSRPPPPDRTVICPVCGASHRADRPCPECGLEPSLRFDPPEIERKKRYYGLGREKREAYEADMESLLGNANFEERVRKVEEINRRYGL